ncbi:MAG: tetratricopeptide repeat protein [Lachnospiraceae bacterium]|nr:tetratricopeptide repeat protein [Lachnospiraceae bacterium]
MRCYNCGAELSEVSFCTNCKSDVTLYKKIIYMSNRLYNEGLEKARVRDLSGAIKCLRQSLKLNNENIDARNLLGLIYFEIGETAQALGEWVISSNYREAENMASEYIGMIQENQAEFDVLKRSAKDFNGALEMSKQGNKDLAMIRLKKLTSANSRYVKAFQLLALLYMDASQFDKAERELSHALSIDKTNTTSLRLMQKIQNNAENTESDRKSIFGKDDEPVRFVRDNELIIQPAGVHEPRSGSLGTIFNIAIGLILGLAVMYFLVLPARITAVREQTRSDIEELQTNLDRRNADYDALQQELNEVNAERIRLEESLNEYTGEAGTLADIDKLLDAANLYLSGGDMAVVGESLWEIYNALDTEKMSDSCKSLYNSLLSAVSPYLADVTYGYANGSYTSGDFEKSAVLFEKAYFYNRENTDAIYFAAVSYQNAGDTVKATDLYKYIVDTYPGTYIEAMSSQALDQLNGVSG